jgi:uncharacterized protein
MIKKALKGFKIVFFSVLISACGSNSDTATKPKNAQKDTLENPLRKVEMKKAINPVSYFEIPVTDVNRATAFYKAVFNFKFSLDTIDNNQMALFPLIDNGEGISGALAKGKSYKPSKNGTLVYFNTDNIAATLQKVVKNGGQILYEKTAIGELGFVAEFEDSEGNRVALHEQ